MRTLTTDPEERRWLLIRNFLSSWKRFLVIFEEYERRVKGFSDRYKTEAKILGIRVRALREKRGWTLEQAAEQSQIDWKHWQKIESGLLNITLVTLVRLAMGLGVTLQALFVEKSEPET